MEVKDDNFKTQMKEDLKKKDIRKCKHHPTWS